MDGIIFFYCGVRGRGGGSSGGEAFARNFYSPLLRCVARRVRRGCTNNPPYRGTSFDPPCSGLLKEGQEGEREREGEKR